ncbi:hypothetical protein CkaCkLH20_07661 [Colletotrichum karsti]|uniref:DUF6604 domain-containing protein n=1 Tax=Colletotrichum karsti TaxID=1095194 RepID=A0A9P6LJV3_9PEZI|nr:uncharacterized protein CkaCkLH20_07661 [Colletotrichum karsti]KAF9874967.1 hypothetical protein CkaCkLH20_07661 [Colletotrichum karsti]
MASEEIDAFAETYWSYKVSTNGFLDWLWCQHESLNPKPASITRTTKGILAAAETLSEAFQKTEQTVPAYIISLLRNAIAKRQEAVTFYRELGADDAKHRIFIHRQVLSQTLHILTPLMAESKNHNAKQPIHEKKRTANFFASLVTVEDVEDDDSVETLAQAEPVSQESANTQTQSVSTKRKHYNGLEDDELQERVETAFLLKAIEDMKALLKKYWTEAAQGLIPIPVASWLTSLVFWHCKRMSLKHFPVSSNVFECQCRRTHKFFAKRPKLASAFQISDLSGAVRFCILAHAINDQQNLAAWLHNPSIAGFSFSQIFVMGMDTQEELLPLRELPTRLPDIDDEEEQPEIWAVMEIFKNINKDGEKNRAIAGLENMKFPMMRGEPCEPILALALDAVKTTDSHHSVDLTFGLDLFLSSYEAFLWPNGIHNNQNCRLQSLRLAKQVQDSVRPTIKQLRMMSQVAGGFSEWADSHQEFHDFLGAYLCENRFDFYHRAPWTAGSHMTEILYKASIIGQAICAKVPIVPSTLHLYNALRKSSFGLSEIPLMEELCELFKPTAFLGNRPDDNFASHFRRSVRGFQTVKEISKSAFYHPDTLDSGFDVACVPVCNLKFIESVFGFQHVNEHIIGFDFMAMVFGETCRTPLTPKEKEKLRKRKSEESPTAFIERAKSLIVTEFQGALPIARVDFFRVFMLCSRIMETFSQLATDWNLIRFSRDFGCHGLRGAGMVEPILEQITRQCDTKKGREAIANYPLCHSAAFAIRDAVSKDAKLSQFLFDV